MVPHNSLAAIVPSASIRLAVVLLVGLTAAWSVSSCHVTARPHAHGTHAAADADLPAPSPDDVVFSVMGCGPYRPEDEKALAAYIQYENTASPQKSAFMVHLGDVVTGRRKDWPESQYRRITEILTSNNRIPTFVVPGDNEWNDQADPDTAWAYWTRHFLRIDERFAFATPVWRSAARPENFAFVYNNVLVIGIHKVGGRMLDQHLWKTIWDDDIAWIQQQAQTHGANAHAMVVLAQTIPEGLDDHFLRPFVAIARAFKKPVLYANADLHEWLVERHAWGADNITHLQLDMLNTEYPPVQVTVRPHHDLPFSFDRRLAIATHGK